MEKKTVLQKLKSSLAFAALGVLLAQGLIFVNASSAKAVEKEVVGDGGCTPKSGDVCSLGGVLFNNKMYYN